MTTLVTIYAPSGAAEKHTTLNAVDLVRDCGYSFTPGKSHLPTEGLPYADPTTGKLPSRAQEALDSVGTGAEVGAEARLNAGALPAGATTVSESIHNPATIKTAPPAAPEPAPEPVIEPTPEPVVEPTPEPVVEAPVEAAPKPRQQRAKKGA